ncbi:hypothetical protein ACSZNV_08270 [Aeromonas hydrophila]
MFDLIKNEVNLSDPTLTDTVKYIRMEAFEKSKETHEEYAEYNYNLKVLSGFKNYIAIDISSKINDLSLFKSYFLMEGKIDSYLAGTMNRIDGKIICPMLSAIDADRNGIQI